MFVQFLPGCARMGQAAVIVILQLNDAPPRTARSAATNRRLPICTPPNHSNPSRMTRPLRSLVFLAYACLSSLGAAAAPVAEFVGPFPSWANVKTEFGAVGDG